MMQISSSVRVFTWFSLRKHLEDNLINLHKCTNLHFVKQIHTQLIKFSLHQDLYIAPKLIAAYSLNSHITSAVNVFNQVPDPNVHLYNYLIRAHVRNNNDNNDDFNTSLAIETFLKMQVNGVFPDNFTYPFVLKGCNGRKWLSLVKMVHAHVEKLGFYGDIFVPNSLIDCYCRCGSVDTAMRFFLGMEERDVVSWNSMVGGLVKCGDFDGALKLFDEMPERDMVSWNTVLDGFAKAGEMEKAFDVFERMGERDIISWSTMVCGYSKKGDMDMARMLFDRCPMKNLVLWTTIISGYAEKGQVKEVIGLYDEMEEAGLRPDDGFLISIWLRAPNRECLCGCLDDGFCVFSGMKVKKDLVSWNSMIHGFGIHGHGEKAIELFTRMNAGLLYVKKLSYSSPHFTGIAKQMLCSGAMVECQNLC
ncbi:pentatricopeptide repeat-containing protein At3g29230-like [Cicer arietinum]|uniref:pentatricopeptide repeat-containing protein At3g29230-like n=1 Tax=Cicer arietinum TaxID=3827 RepID=UPI003CC525B1